MGQTTVSATQPLAGVRIIELSTMVSASLATMMLAAQGAEVIKIEPTAGGDILRYIGTNKAGISAIFANCNRGKKSIAVDLKSDEGRKIVQHLAAEADVLVNNFRPGVMDRLSLGSGQLREANPRLVFAAVNGFGTDGPMANDPAYDQVVQALSGFVGVQSIEGEQPRFIRNLIVDKVTAYTLAQGITGALLARASTGLGQHLDVSMLHAGLFFLFPDGMMNETLLDDDVNQTGPLADALIPFAAKDGFLSMAPSTDAHWAGFAKATNRPNIAEDERYTTLEARAKHAAELYTEAYIALSEMTLEDAIARLRANDVPCAPCLAPKDVVQNEQVGAIGAVSLASHPLLGSIRVAEPPVRFGGELGAIAGDCPSLGEHTHEIAELAGLSEVQIAKLQSSGVLGGAK